MVKQQAYHFTLYNKPMFQPFPKKQILDPFKLKEFAHNNVKFYEKGRKLSKLLLENPEGKGKIARNEQFLLFPQGFRKTCTAHVKTRACLGKD